MKCFLVLLLTAVLVGLVQSDTPTLYPAVPFDGEADAVKLNQAMVGAGTNEQQLINILCRKVEQQRLSLSKSYLDRYGKSLKAEFDGELSGYFKDVMQFLTYAMSDYFALELHRELDKSSLNYRSVQEILISRSNADINDINRYYFDRFGKSLLSDVGRVARGDINHLLSELSKGNRAENTIVDQELVLRDVKDLYSAGAAIEGSNPVVFVDIFTARSWDHLNAVCKEYIIKYARTLEHVIKSEFTGDIQLLLLDLAQFSKNKTTYFAQRFFQAIDGPGTNDYSLIRKVIGRCEIDLADIKVEYRKIYEETLIGAISGDLSGDYRKAVLALMS